MQKIKSVKKFIPASHRVGRYKSLEKMRTDLANRETKVYYLREVPKLKWHIGEQLYKFKCVVSDTSEKDAETHTIIVDAMKVCLGHITKDILNIGSMHNLAVKCIQTDLKKTNKLYDWNGVSEKQPNYAKNLGRFYEMLYDIWEEFVNYYPIMYVTKDVLAPKGMARAIVSDQYVRQLDLDALNNTAEFLQEHDNVRFINGSMSLRYSKACFGRVNPELANDEPTIIGIYIRTSEFKGSGFVIYGCVYLPNKDIYLVGDTAHLKISIPHRISKKFSEEERKKLFEDNVGKHLTQIIENSGELLNWYNFSSRTEVIEIDVAETYRKETSDGKMITRYRLEDALHVNKTKAEKLIEIIKDKGYPPNICGVLYAVMDHSNNEAKTDTEREGMNKKGVFIVEHPQEIQDEFKEVSRTHVIDI